MSPTKLSTWPLGNCNRTFPNKLKPNFTPSPNHFNFAWNNHDDTDDIPLPEENTKPGLTNTILSDYRPLTRNLRTHNRPFTDLTRESDDQRPLAKFWQRNAVQLPKSKMFPTTVFAYKNKKKNFYWITLKRDLTLTLYNFQIGIQCYLVLCTCPSQEH